MRVLFLSTSMGMGGADQQLLSVALGPARPRQEVRIARLTPLGPMGLQARRRDPHGSRWTCRAVSRILED